MDMKLYHCQLLLSRSKGSKSSNRRLSIRLTNVNPSIFYSSHHLYLNRSQNSSLDGISGTAYNRAMLTVFGQTYDISVKWQVNIVKLKIIYISRRTISDVILLPIFQVAQLTTTNPATLDSTAIRP